jgi:hypothetical protein
MERETLFTIKSHIFEAVAIAAMGELYRLEIVRKIVERTIPEKDDYNALDLIEDVGRGKLMPMDMGRLKRRFTAFFSIGWKRTFYRNFFTFLEFILALSRTHSDCKHWSSLPCLLGSR